ncbi:hypothetical protein ACFYYS_19985 [Streptomyces sp. NPDC002120]
MGPATIDPYPMPTRDFVPHSATPWSIAPDRAALPKSHLDLRRPADGS